MHNQSESISDAIRQLEESMLYLDLDFSYIHTGPIIRREVPYQHMSIDERRQLLYKTRCFMLHAPIKYTALTINRREAKDKFSLTAMLSKKLKEFVDDNFEFFNTFDKIVVYYDNGQQELKKSFIKAVKSKHI